MATKKDGKRESARKEWRAAIPQIVDQEGGHAPQNSPTPKDAKMRYTDEVHRQFRAKQAEAERKVHRQCDDMLQRFREKYG